MTDPTAAGLDCADSDSRAFPDAGFQSTAIVGTTRPSLNRFDFNCDGNITQQTPVLNCALPCSDTTTEGYDSAVACGEMGPIGTCVDNVLACTWTAKNPQQLVTQACK